MNVTILHLFEKRGNVPEENIDTLLNKTDELSGRPLLCAICNYVITSEGETIEISGNHFHTCTNPANIVFNIRCFSQAPGCSPVGIATAEHTWFSGYRWQIALCKECGVHLGWLFRDGDSFYGLIADRLSSK